VCPNCAEHRTERRYGVYRDYINWANAPLLAGLQRVERPAVAGVDIPFPVWKSASLPVSKHHKPERVFRVGAASWLGHA